MDNIEKLEESQDALKFLKQLTLRQSIINKGDIINRIKQQREVLRLASFDDQPIIPTQVWYDTLRELDDGSFSKSICVNPNQTLDYVHSKHQEKRNNYIRSKVLTPDSMS